MKVLEAPSRFEGRSSAATFLFGIATNICLNRIRNRAARDDTWAASVARDAEGVRAGLADAAEARQLTAAILAKVDPETAAIAVYHFVDGLPQGEIAKIVGRSRVTVNQRLRRLLRHARHLVERS